MINWVALCINSVLNFVMPLTLFMAATRHVNRLDPGDYDSQRMGYRAMPCLQFQFDARCVAFGLLVLMAALSFLVIMFNVLATTNIVS